MEELLNGIVNPQIVVMAGMLAGLVTFPVMGKLTDSYPDKYWPFMAGAINVVLTLLAAFAAHLLTDPESIAGAILAGGAFVFFTVNAGHRSPKKTLQTAVAEGSLKPTAVEAPALPREKTQDNASK